MKTIYVRNVTKILHGETILESINLTIPGGTFFALLGPSGSGKTTLLRLIAGFESINSGSIWLGDTDITHQPINQRSINTVFQHYALFPHMNVFDNIAYSLRVARVPADVIEQKVMKIVQTVHLEKHTYRAIDQLSGGQQQRVALARAVINEPEVLLLDEPLAALDLKLRERMLIELIELQSTLGTTFLYVTHDQLEALTVADRMAIMNIDGHIEQIGTPKDVYEFPASSFVAQFVGTTNLLKGVLHAEGDKHYFRVDNLGLFEVALAKDKERRSDIQQYMSIRPEKIEITKNPVEGFSNALIGTVAAIVYHGRSTQYNVRLKNGFIVQVFEQNEEHFPREVIDYDDKVYLYWQKENVILLNR
ncbi:MAG TPA: ABC transporter ATP-binding protein [Candidatus Bathyarchaeia archaeon]|nr:ABC transporter ATP-binding protein [Candidatus Bathyarchaeia archaeon]